MRGHNHQSTSRAEFALMVSWTRRWLKQAITLVYASGVVGAATTQRLIDHFELWSD
jgi:hypothetical protein